MKWLYVFLILTLVILSVKAEDDTATSTNILPNAGTTSSSMDNFDLDGVQSGSTGALTNNSTHNGFTITCPTQVNNACGTAFNGEIKEHRIQDSMSTCLKAKRIAMRSSTNRIDYQCIKSKAETEIYMGEKSIVNLILK